VADCWPMVRNKLYEYFKASSNRIQDEVVYLNMKIDERGEVGVKIKLSHLSSIHTNQKNSYPYRMMNTKSNNAMIR
jgi:hypothetical protein